MPFNAMMLTSLLHRLSYDGVAVRRQEGETVLFFEIDEKTNSGSSFREDAAHSGKLCDLVVFYAKPSTSVVLCFTECKGGDVPVAVEQILQTRQTFERELRRRSVVAWRTMPPMMKAYIRHSGGVPRDTKEELRRLEKAFGRRGRDWQAESTGSFEDFLRG